MRPSARWPRKSSTRNATIATKDTGGSSTADAGESQGEQVAIEVQEAAALEPCARAGEEAAGGVPGERRAGRAEGEADPAVTAALGERAREQERAQRDGGGGKGRRGDLDQVGGHGEDDEHRQERERLEECEVAAREVHAVVPARERAREDRREKRADAARSGEAAALADIEKKAHEMGASAGIQPAI